MNEVKMNFIVGLAGNPNTGKSTVFNSITGLKQHTGNWAGKTVLNAKGEFNFKDSTFEIYDLPGMYSLNAKSKDEEVSKEFIQKQNTDALVLVVDSTCFERSLVVALQVMLEKENIILCLNLMDEAKNKKIKIDTEKLSNILNVPVISTSAISNKGIDELKEAIYEVSIKKRTSEKLNISFEGMNEEEKIKRIIDFSEYIRKEVCSFENSGYDYKDRKLDEIITSRKYGIPIMILMLGIVFWITIVLSNYPSMLIQKFFNFSEAQLNKLFIYFNINPFVKGIFIDGMFKTLGWVVSVMLPPMAIFFPLFTILEDYGLLPRIAFNLDYYFKKAKVSGKQALTMCMGFGCNAAGVVATRIIDSERDKLIAIITNNFVPCNGRFPLLIVLSTIFFAGASIYSSFFTALIVILLILSSVFVTLLISYLLSKTILKGESSGFILELPPYRKPQFFKVIIRSLKEKAFYVLLRAIASAIPAGIVIWLMQNIYIGNSSILSNITNFLDPFGKLLGMDGVILTAFILGLPANEIVLPIIIMCYMKSGSLMDIDNFNELKNLLVANGWTNITAICTMLFSLNHFPCSTTCLTIKKETGSFKWTVVSFLVPTIFGIAICFLVNLIFSKLHFIC